MPRKIYQFGSITQANLDNDALLSVVGDPITGFLYKPTIAELKILFASLPISSEDDIADYTVTSALTAPPLSSTEGEQFRILDGATGAWSGHDRQIAKNVSSSWTYITAIEGNYLYQSNTARTYKFTSSNWKQVPGIPILQHGQSLSNGVSIGTNNNKPFNFLLNKIEVAKFDTDGWFKMSETIDEDFYQMQLRGGVLQFNNTNSDLGVGSRQTTIMPNVINVINTIADEGVAFNLTNTVGVVDVVFQGSLNCSVEAHAPSSLGGYIVAKDTAGGNFNSYLSSKGIVFPIYTDAEVTAKSLTTSTVSLIIWSATRSQLERLNTTTHAFVPLFTPSSGLTAANNGLSVSGTTAQLGGPLIADTTITAGTNRLDITGSRTNGIVFITNTGSSGLSNGLEINVNAGYGLKSTVTGGGGNPALYGNGSSFGLIAVGASVGAMAQSNGLPLRTVNSASTATINTHIQSQQTSEVTGEGVSLDTMFGSSTVYSRLITTVLNSTVGSRLSEFSLQGIKNSTTLNTLLKIDGGGQFTLSQGLQDFADDTAAATGLIPVNGLYRNGSIVQIRVS